MLVWDPSVLSFLNMQKLLVGHAKNCNFAVVEDDQIPLGA